MPVLFPTIWHKHYGKISLAWALATLIPLVSYFGKAVTVHTLLDTYIHHFIPFIIFVLVFYTICGGIKIDIICRATALLNTMYIAFATILASWIGTIGAAMLFIRPLLHINKRRAHQRHLVIFFIFLVCNIGGSLTPLGDPPLFLGFLNGVDFFWTTANLMGPFLTAAIPLLCIFYLFDRSLSNRETSSPRTEPITVKVRIQGGRNILFLGLAIAIISISGVWHSKIILSFFGTSIPLQNLLRDLFLLILTFLSLNASPQKIRQENAFTWSPFKEVCIIFAAIFMTAAPVFSILQAGSEGAFAGLLNLINHNGQQNHHLYFWLTGILSSLLDNAPTYLIFFNMAGGDAQELMTTYARTLTAISLGAVFMGALTYIGNVPNFMVKAIAEEHAIKMPSFLGYLKWSVLLLVPLFIILGWLWI
jgi:Na+/H+ antiporter NhaD/arsenite permease-like protein